VIDCGLPPALSLIATAADRAPVAFGANVTVIVQLLLAASVAGLTGQVFVWVKSPGLAPVTPMLLIVSVPGPLLVNVTLCPALVVPVF
jgi:hypothetical protein